jgi:hypothetical protein
VKCRRDEPGVRACASCKREVVGVADAACADVARLRAASAHVRERGEIGTCECADAVEGHHDHATRPAAGRGPASGRIERALVAPIEGENRPGSIGKAALEIRREAQRLAAENGRHARRMPAERLRACCRVLGHREAGVEP